MNKTCDSCYWQSFDDRCLMRKKSYPVTCDEYRHTCECEEEAEYKYKEKYYCAECLVKEFKVEEYKVTHYMVDGSCIGTDEDMEEVIDNLDSGIEKIY